MMSGLRSHFEKMITCVSERSGSASTAMCWMLQTPIATRTATMTMTRPRFVAHQRMTRSITGAPRKRKPETRNQKPEEGGWKLETRNQKPEEGRCFFWFLVSGFWFHSDGRAYARSEGSDAKLCVARYQAL